MNFLTKIYEDNTEFQGYLNSLSSDNSSIYIHGVIKEAFASFVYATSKNIDKPLVVVVEDNMRARNLTEYLNDIEDNICEFFPNRELNLYNARSLDDNAEDQRVNVLFKLLNNEKFIIVTTFDALTKKITKKSVAKKYSFTIKDTDLINLEELQEKLKVLKYERVDTIESKGQFAIRGGIVDIFPVHSRFPVRIELFDDEIDSMRFFEVSTQRSIEDCKFVDIISCSELIIEESKKESIINSIQKNLDKRVNHPIFGENVDNVKDKFEKLMEYIRSDLEYEIDLVSCFLTKKDYDAVFDYFLDDSIMLIEDLSRCYDIYKEKEKRFLEDFVYLVEKGEVLSKHEQSLIPISDILKLIKSKKSVNITSLVKRTRLIESNAMYQLKTLEAPNFNKNIDSLVENIKSNSLRGFKQIVFAANVERKNMLKDLFLTNGIPTLEAEDYNANIKSSQVLITQKNLPNGFEIKDPKYLIITYKEIFGREKQIRKRKKKKSTGQDIVNYSDLNIDDYVVHENHGIGQYKGIEKIDVNGIQKDYIVIQYKANDRLMIPTDQMNLVQKYIGGGNIKKPSLNKLSGNDWAKAKQKAKKSVDEMADDLVELYSKRAKLKGYQFSQDTEWQREFEDSFPYEETDSQIRSIEEIKTDMESDRPMDRLLCGDVGYGKTEVAIRACFKAIMDGKQVAFLVPTTILAQQHFNTIKERFRDYPIRVEMMSRFVSQARQKQIMKDVQRGLVDLLVGTHRILSKNLKFKDLGLLVIDEEQRFGVRHKEKLKSMRENVDVLTLSATPIPRTLQMGLTGIRDMSLLEEPPEDRTPISTYVTEYNPSLIRDAIIRELDRGGQIYFVYNRIEDIDQMEFKLKELVPELNIAIAHGRMNEKELENVMLDFQDGIYDLLLCTTIIETGLDIQNVNTMIIYNADKMGLSQLYQLKGRIGRSDRTSFAYFTYEGQKSLTEISEKRLMAIKDFTEFGSGFKIAMRDLELRGAGNLLGESQHGHIAKIGYDLYVKLLEQAVREAKGETVSENKNIVQIEIKVNGYIPEDYISENETKIDIYKKIASIQDEDDYSEIIDELIDRFGDVPKPIVNIMDVSIIKAFCARLSIESIKEIKGELFLQFSSPDKISLEKLKYLTENYKKEMRFDLSEKPKIILGFEDKNLRDPIEVLSILLKDNEK